MSTKTATRTTGKSYATLSEPKGKNFSNVLPELWRGRRLSVIVNFLNSSMHEVLKKTSNSSLKITIPKDMINSVFPEYIHVKNKNKEKFSLERSIHYIMILSKNPDGIAWLKSKKLSDRSISCLRQLDSRKIIEKKSTCIKKKTLNDISELFSIFSYFSENRFFCEESEKFKSFCSKNGHSKERLRYAIYCGSSIQKNIIQIIFRSSIINIETARERMLQLTESIKSQLSETARPFGAAAASGFPSTAPLVETSRPFEEVAACRLLSTAELTSHEIIDKVKLQRELFDVEARRLIDESDKVIAEANLVLANANRLLTEKTVLLLSETELQRQERIKLTRETDLLLAETNIIPTEILLNFYSKEHPNKRASVPQQELAAPGIENRGVSNGYMTYNSPLAGQKRKSIEREETPFQPASKRGRI
jgi:hypothetical protein